MKRVLVIGRPGAGKTLFAVQLAKITKLPLIHLDYYYHDPSMDYYNPLNKPAWFTKVKQLLKRDKWIMDGNYSTTMPDRFKRADTVFYFDFSLPSSLLGVLRRRWHYRNKKRSDMPDSWKEKIEFGFLNHTILFNLRYRRKTLGLINKYPSKEVIIFKKRREANEYLKSLKTSVKYKYGRGR